MACAQDRKYAERSSTRFECPICMESYEYLKILPCKHEMCSKCLDQLILRETLLCPHCRISFNQDSDFKTKDSWNLECFGCSKMKPSEEFNWCVECAQLLCCLCLVRQHEPTNHTIQIWDSGIPVIASLKSKLTGNCLQLEDQQRLLKNRMSELVEPILESISKKMVNSNYLVAKSLLKAFSFDTENMSTVKSNANGQDILSIAAKISGIDVKDMLDVPISLKDPSTFEDRVRSHINFGPEPSFLKNVKESENQELAPNSSTISSRDVPFKIAAVNLIPVNKGQSPLVQLVRISLNCRKIVVSHFASEDLIYDLDIMDNGQTSPPQIIDHSLGTKLPGTERMQNYDRSHYYEDGKFHPAKNEYYLLGHIKSIVTPYFQLSVIDLDSMKRTCLWNSGEVVYSGGRLSCSPSGVLFILMYRKRSQEPEVYGTGKDYKTDIYTTRRNETGESEQVVLKIETNISLVEPFCYEIGSDAFLMAQIYDRSRAYRYRYDGSEMSFVGEIRNNPIYTHGYEGRIVKCGNSFIRIMYRVANLTAFTRDGHEFKAIWKFERWGIIRDVAVDGDRVLIAFKGSINRDESVDLEWFSLDALQRNSV